MKNKSSAKQQFLIGFNKNSKSLSQALKAYYNLHPAPQAYHLPPFPISHMDSQPIDPLSIPRICLLLSCLSDFARFFPPPRIHFLLSQNISILQGPGPVQPLLEDVSWLSPNFSLTPLTSKGIWIVSLSLSLLSVSQDMLISVWAVKFLRAGIKQPQTF